MNEPQTQLRHEQIQDRLYALEEGHRNIQGRLTHLDKCVDKVKEKVEKWESRSKAFFWATIGAIIASGSGYISLQHFLELLKVLK